MIAIGQARALRAAREEPVPYLDCLALMLLPLMMNLSAVPQIPMQRSIVLLFFGAFLFKNIVMYPAQSRIFQRNFN